MQPLVIVERHLRDIARRALATAGDVPAKRALVDEYFHAHPVIPARDIDYSPVTIGRIHGEWIKSGNSDPARRLLYLHGGSWMAGRVAAYRPHIARLADATRTTVLAIDYALAPEDPYPEGLRDCVTAMQWLYEAVLENCGPAQQVFVAGDSAGANLALATLLMTRDEGLRQAAGAVLMSAPTDQTWSGTSMVANAARDAALNASAMPLITEIYLHNHGTATDPYVSPLYADLAALPPLLLQVGDTEILLDDSRRFRDRAITAGVDVEIEIYPGMPHVFQGFAPLLTQASRALQHCGRFLERLR